MSLIAFRFSAAAATLLLVAGLQGCGPYGLKGDRGLPPPPEGVAYPSLGRGPADAQRRLKSPGEQEQAKSSLLASKPRTARQPRPFNPPAQRR